MKLLAHLCVYTARVLSMPRLLHLALHPDRLRPQPFPVTLLLTVYLV